MLRDAGDLPEQRWLRTGDLGVLVDGELYITGRMKDTIIIDGRNIYPNDVEATVEEAHPAIAAHRLAAFAVDTGDDAADASTLMDEVEQFLREQDESN